MALRTGSLPRKAKERFDTPPEIFTPRAALLDLARRLDEVDAVVVVLLDAGGDGEDVGVEDDVLGREADLVHQDVVGAGADLDLALLGVGLALLVERHDHDRGAVAAHLAGVRDEGLDALLHGDRVHDRLAGDAFQAGLDHAPLGAVDHDRHAGDVGLGGDQLQERVHRQLGIEQALVHVDVDDLRAALDLLARDLDRGRVVALEDQLLEPGRARDVGALADIDEGGALSAVSAIRRNSPLPCPRGAAPAAGRATGAASRPSPPRRSP